VSVFLFPLLFCNFVVDDKLGQRPKLPAGVIIMLCVFIAQSVREMNELAYD
jgi:hypothetical protein